MPQIIGALRGVLGLDSAAFDTGVNRALASMSRMERRMSQVGHNLARAGRTASLGITLPMAAAATAAVRSSLKTVDAQAKMAQSLGTTVKSMQVLDRAADLSGVKIGEMEQATIQLTKRLSEVAKTGKGPAAEGLKALRLSAKALIAEPLDERVADIQTALAAYVPEAERAAVATRLFGDRAGLIFSRIDTATLQTATADVARFGIAVTEVQADQIERTNDALSRLGLISRGIANQLTAALAPVLEGIADKAAQVGDWFNSLSDSGKRLVVTGAAVVAAIGPVALAVGTLSLGLAGLASPIGVAVAGFGLLAAGVAAVTAVTGDSGKAARAHEQAMDNVTIAMGDQIHASAQLSATLAGGQAMTLAMVEANIADARARRAVIEALIEQRREAELAALGYYGLLEQIGSMRAALDALRAPGDDLEQMPAHLRASYEETERALAALLARQQEMLASVRARNHLNEKERANLDQIEANLAELQRRMAAFAGATADSVVLSERLSRTDVSAGITPAVAAAIRLKDELNMSLRAALAITGALDTRPRGDVFDPREPSNKGREAQLERTRRLMDSITYSTQVATREVKKYGGGASSASRSAVQALRTEIAERQKLLGMTDKQRRAYEAMAEVTRRLGDQARTLSRVEIEALAGQLAALERNEDALSRVSELQRQWSENITRTAFEGGDMGDVVEGILRDIQFQIANTQIVMPIVAQVTDVLGLSGLLGGGSAGNAAGGGGSAGGLLGGVLGSGGFFGAMSKGFGLGLKGLFGAGGGLGTYFGSLGAQLGTVFAGGFSTSALGGLLGMAGPIAVGIGLLAKGLSQKYAGTALRGSLTPGGFEGTQFDFFRGGVLRGDRADYSAVPDEVQGLLDRAMKGVTTGLKGMALSLGLGTAALAGFADAEFTLWTNGKDAAQIQAELGERIEGATDKMAALVLGTERFTRDGESANDTLTRLSSSLTGVNTMMDTLDHRLFRVSLRGADAASALAEAFGGLEAMQSATAAYWQGFYSEQERAGTQLRQLRARFADLGLVMPESRAGFRSLVEGISTTTERGRELYAGLLGMAGALDQVLPKVANVTLAMSGLLDTIGGEIGGRIDAAREAARASARAAAEWYRASDGLRALVRDIDGTALGGKTSAAQLAANRAAFDAAVAAARGGDVDAARDVPALARAVLDGARATAVTGEDYRFAAAQVRAQVSLLSGVSGLEGANDEVIAALYEKQIAVLTDLDRFLQLEGLSGADLKALDKGTRKMLRDWDGTVGAFDGTLKAVTRAIRQAENFSYDKILADLDVTIGLSGGKGVPNWLQRLAKKAGNDLRTTLDFVVRRDDLTPPLKWIAVKGLKDQVQVLDFVVRKDLGKRQSKIALSTGGRLRRDLRFTVEKDLPKNAKRIALAGNSLLSRRVRLALTKGGADVVDKLTRLQKMIGRKGDGTITFDGGIALDPEKTFADWYDAASRTQIRAPMRRLRGMLDALRKTVAADTRAREKQEKTRARIATLEGRNATFEGNWGGGSAEKVLGLKDRLDALVASTGVTLKGVRITGDGRLVYDPSGVGGSADQVAAFRASGFWAGGGLQDQIAAANANRLDALAYQDKLRQAIVDLGGVPTFASGGLHTGGLRLVGESGAELEATGPARYWSAGETREMLSGGTASGEMAAIRRELSEMRQYLSNIETHTHDSKVAIRRIDAIGVKDRT